MIAATKIVSSTISELHLIRCTTVDCSNYTVRIIDSGDSQGRYPSLALQSNGFPFMSYAQPSTSQATVSFTICDDWDCNAIRTFNNLLPSGNTVPGWTSAALIDNVPSVAFTANTPQSESAIYYWRFQQTFSGQPIFLDPLANAFQWGSDRNMAVMSNVGNPPLMAFYRDSLGLLILSCFDVACSLPQTKVVDSASFFVDVGLYPSVAVHPVTGLAVVAYHDATNLILKMVFCTNKFCTDFVVRSFPSAYGWDPSVGFDPLTLLPMVAFSDPSINGVLLMSCSDSLCNTTSSVNLAAGLLPQRRVETVKMLPNATNRPFVIGHDSLATTLQVWTIESPACSSPCGSVSVTITQPMVNPFVTNLTSVVIQGTINVTGTAFQVMAGTTPLMLNSATGAFSGAVPLVAGTNTIQVSVSQQGVVVGQSVPLIVVSDTTPPILNVTNPASLSGSTPLSTFQLQGFVTDSLSLVTSVTAFNFASGVATSSVTGSPSWAIDVALYPATANVIGITATDEAGNAVTVNVTITQTGAAAAVICPANVTIECGATIPPPSGASVVNCIFPLQVSEVFISRCGKAGVYRRTYSACNAACIQTVTVVDTTPPSISCPTPTTVSCEIWQSGKITAVATDSCDPSPIVTSSNASCGISASLQTFTATDACGNKASCSYQLTILAAVTTVATTPASGGLTAGDIGGLVAGIILLFLILLLSLLVIFLWRRKRAREAKQDSVAILDHEYDMSELSTSSSVSNKMYKQNPYASREDQDFGQVI